MFPRMTTAAAAASISTTIATTMAAAILRIPKSMQVLISAAMKLWVSLLVGGEGGDGELKEGRDVIIKTNTNKPTKMSVNTNKNWRTPPNAKLQAPTNTDKPKKKQRKEPDALASPIIYSPYTIHLPSYTANTDAPFLSQQNPWYCFHVVGNPRVFIFGHLSHMFREPQSRVQGVQNVLLNLMVLNAVTFRIRYIYFFPC